MQLAQPNHIVEVCVTIMYYILLPHNITADVRVKVHDREKIFMPFGRKWTPYVILP